MTEQEALEELVRRACRNNLYIGTRGTRPPHPNITTYIENANIDVLFEIRTSLGGQFKSGDNARNPTPRWVAIGNEATGIIKKLIPMLKTSKHPTATMKACYAEDVLLRWRQQKIAEKKQHAYNQNQ